MRLRLLSVGAISVGSIPSLILPVVLVTKLPARESDLFLLALSVSTLVGSITASSYEASMLVAVGRAIAGGNYISRCALRALLRRAIILGIALTMICYPALCEVYAAAAHSKSITFEMLYVDCSPLIMVAIIMCASSVWAGFLTARRRLPSVFFSSFFRGSPNLVGVFIVHTVFTLSLVYTLGELVRYIYLEAIARRDLRHYEGHLPMSETAPALSWEMPSLRSLLHQMTSMALSQATPVLTRVFLVMGPAGTVSAGEVANRIYSGGAQLSNSGVVMPMVASFPGEVLGGDAQSAGKATRTGIIKILVNNSILSALMGLGVVISLVFVRGSTQRLEKGLVWSLILILALPALGLNIWAGRGLVLARRTSSLPVLALISLAVSAVVALALFWVIGPVAAMLGVLVGQAVDGFTCAWLLLRVGPAIFAEPA
jgi:hypothetical protein